MARAHRKKRKRRDWGRVFAVLVAAIFALVGLLPLALGILVQAPSVRNWAAQETSTLLKKELGVEAAFDLEMTALPLAIELSNVRVESSDRPEPFLTVESASIRPRLFSLLAGKLDVGDVEVVGPRVYAIIEDGELKNLDVELPETSDDGPTEPPLSTLTVTDARVDLKIDDTIVAARRVDVDVLTADGGAVEIAWRAGASSVVRTRGVPGREHAFDAIDEDHICELDGRLRVDDKGILVRRAHVMVAVDFDPAADTALGCHLAEDDWRRLELSLRHLSITELDHAFPNISGEVRGTFPLAVAHRFAAMPLITGQISLDVELESAPDAKIPIGLAGTIDGKRIGLDGKMFADHIAGGVRLRDDVIRMSGLDVGWAAGDFEIDNVTIEPFAPGMPLTSGPVRVKNANIYGILRDVGVHARPHVSWLIEKADVATFGGTLDPLQLSGVLDVQSRDFFVYDRPHDDPKRQRLVGVPYGDVRGELIIREDAAVLANFAVQTPVSRIFTSVVLGYDEALEISVSEGSVLDFADLTPIASVPIRGKTKLSAQGSGSFSDPVFTGSLSIEDFGLGDFDIGQITQAEARFTPLVLELENVGLQHGDSVAASSHVSIDFGAEEDIRVDAQVDTTAPPHLSLRDFFDVFRFDDDPRFADLAGLIAGRGRVLYALGGGIDKCGSGYIDVDGSFQVIEPHLFGETFDAAAVDFDFTWEDLDAGDRGMRLSAPALTLKKGPGSVMADVSVRHGGALNVSAIASGIPLSEVDALGSFGGMLDGSMSMTANIGGTVSAMAGNLDVNLSPIRIGPGQLPASRLTVQMLPRQPVEPDVGVTGCGRAKAAPFDRAAWDRDESSGDFVIDGELLGGQVEVKQLVVSQQRQKTIRGEIDTHRLDLGTLANLIPGVAFSKTPPQGELSANVVVEHLEPHALARTEAEVIVHDLNVHKSGFSVELSAPDRPIALSLDQLFVPELPIQARSDAGLVLDLTLAGQVRRATSAPDLDLSLTMAPVNLEKLGRDIEGVDSLEGIVGGAIRMTGPPAALRYAGNATLREGALRIDGSPVSVDDANIDVVVGDGDIRITKATASVGGGTVAITGRAPLVGTTLGEATASVIARGVKVPVADGIELTANADLDATLPPSREGQTALPQVKGRVELISFDYTRPISMSVDLKQFAGTNKRTEVETYDPSKDVIEFDLNIVSPQPLRFENNLISMELEVDESGLRLLGTNQRFGARGELRVLPDSKVQLRSHEFVVREGRIQFDRTDKIAPRVDVRAETEYRRYAATADVSAGAGDAGSATSGQWRITMHAHGDAENLKLDLSSDPPLAQEDIVLLLTVGMTRAEVDRSLASSLGETLGLEALSSLTGADTAITSVVPIIDHFSFGSGYSSRTGRTEPNVTIGKRLTDDVRANVTTTLTESDVSSSLEWRLPKGVSVQGSYDNTNDINSSSIGNLGADLRWRLEFE